MDSGLSSQEDFSDQCLDKLLNDFELFETTFLTPFYHQTLTSCSPRSHIDDNHGIDLMIDLNAAETENDVNECAEADGAMTSSTGGAATGEGACSSTSEMVKQAAGEIAFQQGMDGFEMNLWLEYWNASILDDQLNSDQDINVSTTNEGGNSVTQELLKGNHAESVAAAGVSSGVAAAPKELCCGGRCRYGMESRGKEMEKPRKGRRKKGYKPTPELLAVTKERQKLRNRESAARSFAKQKAYMEHLRCQVIKLRAENRLRKTLLKFLECSAKLHESHERSPKRTTSGPI